jgi:hypothetical protein
MVTAYGIEHILSPLGGGDMVQMREAFPEVPAGGLVAAAGEVSLLMGQDNLSLFPSERKRIGNAALYMSRFRTGWIASGRPPRANGGGSNRHVGVCIARTIGHEPVESVSRPEPQQEDMAICAVSMSSHQWVAPHCMSKEASSNHRIFYPQNPWEQICPAGVPPAGNASSEGTR